MKKWIGLCTLIFCFGLSMMAQKNKETPLEIPSFPTDEATGQVVYKGVVEFSGTPLSLHEKALEWVNAFYPNPKGIIRNEVKGELIEGVARFRLYGITEDGKKLPGSTMMYDIKIQFKEGKCRYIFSNIGSKEATFVPVEKWIEKHNSSYNKTNAQNLIQVEENMLKVSEDFKTFMSKQASNNQDDW